MDGACPVRPEDHRAAQLPLRPAKGPETRCGGAGPYPAAKPSATGPRVAKVASHALRGSCALGSRHSASRSRGSDVIGRPERRPSPSQQAALELPLPLHHRSDERLSCPASIWLAARRCSMSSLRGALVAVALQRGDAARPAPSRRTVADPPSGCPKHRQSSFWPQTARGAVPPGMPPVRRDHAILTPPHGYWPGQGRVSGLAGRPAKASRVMVSAMDPENACKVSLIEADVGGDVT